MSEPQVKTMMLSQFTSEELDDELTRRACAAGGHTPFSWTVIHDTARGAVRADGRCQCGGQKWEAVRVGD